MGIMVTIVLYNILPAL